MNLTKREAKLARFAMRRYWNYEMKCAEGAERRGKDDLADHIEDEADECADLYVKLGGDRNLLGSGIPESKHKP